jgi:quercetin dioxygenase-like cupin family protein
MNAKYFATPLLLAASMVAGRIDAQQTTQAPIERAEHKMIVAEELQWQPGPESLPKGAEFVVLEGDPAKEGLFTMRIKIPPNYRIPPHTHPKVERVTVLEGEAKLGMGRKWDEQRMKRLPAGAFFTMPPGMEHFAGTETGAVIQLNGIGPWEIIYLNPGDDPRNRTQ